jgi:hypothetical protein
MFPLAPNLALVFLVWDNPLGVFPEEYFFLLPVTLVLHRIQMWVFLMARIGLVVLQLVLKPQAHLILVLDRT